MRRSLAKFSESEASNHTPSLADFTTTTPELKFSVHTTSKAHTTIPICNVHVDVLVFARHKRAVMRNKVKGLFEFVHSLLQPILASPLTPKNSKIKNRGQLLSFLFAVAPNRTMSL